MIRINAAWSTWNCVSMASGQTQENQSNCAGSCDSDNMHALHHQSRTQSQKHRPWFEIEDQPFQLITACRPCIARCLICFLLGLISDTQTCGAARRSLRRGSLNALKREGVQA